MEGKAYRRTYLTGTSSQKFYGLPKIQKRASPLDPKFLVGAQLHLEFAKELARILKHLDGKTTHHINNT